MDRHELYHLLTLFLLASLVLEVGFTHFDGFWKVFALASYYVSALLLFLVPLYLVVSYVGPKITE